MKKPERNPLEISSGYDLIDTHCHLDMPGYENLQDVLESSVRAGVRRVISVGIDVASSRKAVEIAALFPNVFAAIGIHPHAAAAAGGEMYQTLAALLGTNKAKIVAYGEIGLDYAKKYAPRDMQLRVFRQQLRLAGELGLPVIIHDRDAHEDILDTLKKNKPYPAGGVMHCFSGDSEMARKVIDFGFYISIPGIVTFAKSETMQRVVRETPLAHIILESDGPFLAPVPYRGKINRPGYLVYTAGKIAELKKTSLQEVARQTTKNAEALFHLTATKTFH
ncbi:MAG: TatD family hydrolase [Desulfobulbaceae bacterium]|nr:TatD family hydrolase [Desulfobulbaceae bacterium]